MGVLQHLKFLLKKKPAGRLRGWLGKGVISLSPPYPTTYEDVLRAFFEQEFQVLQHTHAGSAVSACARLTARMVLQGSDQAVGIAQLHLGQWPSNSSLETWAWQ